jgi:hypothetical protein
LTQKLNLAALANNLVLTDQNNRIHPPGSKKESDKDLVKWLTDLQIGKEIIDKV